MKATVRCHHLTTGEYSVSGASNQPFPPGENTDPAAVLFHERALAEIPGARREPFAGFGVIVPADALGAARHLARSVFGIDWEESSALDRQAVIGMFTGQGYRRE